ncbi:MAG: YfhO family protein, partial [Sedimentisphaerales bacterium]
YKFGQNLYLYEDKKVLPRAYFLNSHNTPDLNAGRVEINNYRPGFISLKTSAKRAGRLFISEARYPGWQALVDDKNVKILESNKFFQAIDLPAGEHEVKFIYDPWSLKAGAGVSLLALAGLLVLFFANKSFHEQ